MGKITVKHFLNKKVKPIPSKQESSKEDKYSVYLRITANRKTTDLRSRIGNFLDPTLTQGSGWLHTWPTHNRTPVSVQDASIYLSEKEFDVCSRSKDHPLNILLKQERTAVELIYEYLGFNKNKNLDVKQFNKVLPIFYERIINAINDHCVQEVVDRLGNSEKFSPVLPILNSDFYFKDLIKAIDLISPPNIKTEFRTFFNSAIHLPNIFFTAFDSYGYKHITIIEWIVNDYTRLFEEHIETAYSFDIEEISYIKEHINTIIENLRGLALE